MYAQTDQVISWYITPETAIGTKVCTEESSYIPVHYTGDNNNSLPYFNPLYLYILRVKPSKRYNTFVQVIETKNTFFNF